MQCEKCNAPLDPKLSACPSCGAPVPQNIEGVGTLYPKYKVSVIKKNTGIDPSVITILKEMTNARGEAMIGMIDFSDLTE